MSPRNNGIVETISMDIQPQANVIWRGLGGTFDSYMQIICEFLDNSLASFENSGGHISQVHISLKEDENHILTEIEDTAKGIEKNDLKRCLTIGEEPEGNSLRNEHGWGLKHALAAADPVNSSWAIYTKCSSDILAGQYRQVKAPFQNNINQEVVNSEEKSWPGKDSFSTIPGTLIVFPASKEIFSKISARATIFDTLVSRLKERLGYIYANIIDEGIMSMNISASSRGLRNRDAEAIPAIKPYWIESYNPDPASVTKDLGAGELEISYHFGRIQERQNQKECYRANMRQQGAEIRLNGRLIVDSLFSEIWNKEPNNQYNYFRAVIDLKCNQRGVAPQTRTHKDGFRETEIYANLLRFIKQKHPTPVSEYNPSTQDENSLRDLVFEAKKVHLQGSPTIDKELSVFTSLDVDVKADLYIDDGTDVTVYECKKDSTRVLDLYQLLMYWDGCVYDNIQPTKGILLASNHSPSVEQVIIYLNELKDNNGVNYNFETRTWNDENILYPDNPNLV